MKDIKGFEGKYLATESGFIYSSRLCGFLKGQKNRKGYLILSLIGEPTGGVRKSYAVHRLIAKTFLPNPDGLPQVNHKNCNKKDNAVENLEWCTNLDNMRHAIQNGIFPLEKGTRNTKLTSDDVIALRNVAAKGKVTWKEIGRLFGVKESTVSNIVARRLWPHVA